MFKKRASGCPYCLLYSENLLVRPCAGFVSVVRPGDGVCDLARLLKRLLDPLVSLLVLLPSRGVPDLNDVWVFVGVCASRSNMSVISLMRIVKSIPVSICYRTATTLLLPGRETCSFARNCSSLLRLAPHCCRTLSRCSCSDSRGPGILLSFLSPLVSSCTLLFWPWMSSSYFRFHFICRFCFHFFLLSPGQLKCLHIFHHA